MAEILLETKDKVKIYVDKGKSGVTPDEMPENDSR